MIGGAMLLCAVGAMVLIAAWSLARDEEPDSRPRDGLLALRDTGQGTGEAPRPRGWRQRRSVPKVDSRRHTALDARPRKPRPLRFDADEMADVAEEIARGRRDEP